MLQVLLAPVQCNRARRLCQCIGDIAHNIACNVTHRQCYRGNNIVMFVLFGFCVFFCEQLLTCNVLHFVQKCVF